MIPILSNNLNEGRYLGLLNEILHTGNGKEDRTNTGTRAVFGRQTRYSLSDGQIPLLTSKSIHLKSVIHELLWMLAGDTNVKYLQDNGVKIWDEWADENGNLGRVYGAQWRSWRNPFQARDQELGTPVEYFCEPLDQMANLMRDLKENPFSRRHIVTAWNPAELEDMALPPCHCFMQFFVEEQYGERQLSCQLYQRSADMFLGVPFNIASYSILTHMIANALGYKAKEFVHTIGDAHIYNNHVEQVKEQLERKYAVTSPMLKLPLWKGIFSYKFEDFDISNYEPQPSIKAPVAV
tara:strand:- start:3983 stop:4864 length:882 start_codon:yes stop_codon:yes gene_type:complete